MKKLLIGLLIALALMCLLFVACNACDKVPTAQAFIYPYYNSNSGIVGKNLLPSSFVEDVSYNTTSYTSAVSSSLPDGFYSNQSQLPVLDSTTGYATFTGPVRYSFYYLYTVPVSGYYFFALSFTQNDAYSVQFVVADSAHSDTVSCRSTSSYQNIITSYPGTSSALSRFYFTAGTRVCFCPFLSNASTVVVKYVKLEYFDSMSYDSSFSGFTGFAIPGVSYDLPGDGDSWDGVVAPNLLNAADFYEFPLYGQNLGSSTGQEAYWTDISTSNFTRSFNPDLVDPTNVTVPGVSYISYRYNVPAAQQGKAHTYSLYLYTPHKLAITLTSSAGGSTVYEVYNDGVNGLVSLTIPAEQVGSYIYINVQFLSQSTYTAILYYSKLEVGSFFTGYVPIEHGEANVVNPNVLSNYNFYTIPTNTYDTNTWYFSQNNPLTITRGDENNNGINIWTSSSSSTTPTILTYLYDYSGFTEGDNLTFALRGKTDIPFAITVTGDVSGTATQLVYYYFLATGYGDQTDIVVHFQYHDNLRIDLTFFEEGQYGLFFAKLELGDTFTGYCESALAFSQESYEQGYARGFQDGASTYASQTVTFAFDDVESYTRIALGWSHFGFTGGEQLKDSYWSMTSSWYEYKGYIIAYAGFDFVYSDQAMTNVIGVRVYISRNPDFWALVNDSVYDDTLQCLMINVFETYSTLTILDSEFPEDPNEWFPSPTVNLRLFNVTYNRGYETLLREYGEAAGSIAYGEGYAKGSSQGYLQGKADGYALAEKTLSNSGWLAFFSAFVDVPIHVITGLLDFEFFGFNLLSLVKILLLFSLTFMVIRLFTKGKVEQ